MLPEKLVADIIKEQSLIIGESLARNRAELTGMVSFKSNNINDVSLSATDLGLTLEKLVNSFEEVFGQASVEVCIDVIKRYPQPEVQGFLPEKLKSAILI